MRTGPQRPQRAALSMSPPARRASCRSRRFMIKLEADMLQRALCKGAELGARLALRSQRWTLHLHPSARGDAAALEEEEDGGL